MILTEKTSLLTRSHSSISSIVQLNNHETDFTLLTEKPSITDEQTQHGFSSSSPGTSTDISHEHEQRSSSSKLYDDYKKKTSIASLSVSTIPNHSAIINPLHSHFGLRSSTSSTTTTTNEKLTDMTLPSKQMNVCVINQLNEHFSTRFRKQRHELCSSNNNYDTAHRQNNYPLEEYISTNNEVQSNVDDEPNNIAMINSRDSNSMPPPPPPPYVK